MNPTFNEIYANWFKIYMFIKYRQGEPIPDELKFQDW